MYQKWIFFLFVCFLVVIHIVHTRNSKTVVAFSFLLNFSTFASASLTTAVFSPACHLFLLVCHLLCSGCCLCLFPYFTLIINFPFCQTFWVIRWREILCFLCEPHWNKVVSLKKDALLHTKVKQSYILLKHFPIILPPPTFPNGRQVWSDSAVWMIFCRT